MAGAGVKCRLTQNMPASIPECKKSVIGFPQQSLPGWEKVVEAGPCSLARPAYKVNVTFIVTLFLAVYAKLIFLLFLPVLAWLQDAFLLRTG